MSNFINIHVLISHSPSCLNRDDMNMQKDAIFGGKRRVRISSQSLKRAMRKSGYYALNRPGFPGECFICELRLPDHRFRWKHNKLFLLLPEEYGPAF
ncbi:hypothetical protein GQE67_11100, partial [Escherichia coli]|nr:hypothetical protein [Escherichia coli]